MVTEVAKTLRIHKLQQNTLKAELGDRYQPKEGFEELVFTSQFGSPLFETYINRNLARIVAEINKQEQALAKKEGREPVSFEKITPHALRHTFATRAFERGMKPKTVQEILGHSSLSMTMDLYTHVTEDVKVEEMKKLEKQA